MKVDFEVNFEVNFAMGGQLRDRVPLRESQMGDRVPLIGTGVVSHGWPPFPRGHPINEVNTI